MPKVTIVTDIEVWCDACGAGLCNISDGGNKSITVGPCSSCMEEAKEEGREEGRQEAEEE